MLKLVVMPMFCGIERLYGRRAVQITGHIASLISGVGPAAEALVAQAGELTLIDWDDICFQIRTVRSIVIQHTRKGEGRGIGQSYSPN